MSPALEDEMPEQLPTFEPKLLEDPAPRRIPHLGHAILFVALTYLLLNISGFLIVAIRAPHDAQQMMTMTQQPRVRVGAEALAYLLTLAIAWLVFPMMWQQSFAEGIRWNLAKARSLAVMLVPLGLAFGMAVQFVNGLLPMPKQMPIQQFFQHRADVWVITIFGTLLGPLFEEITFRGFLFPAVATAYDWLAIKHTPEAYAEWQSSTRVGRPAIFVSAVLTSLLFAFLHAPQLNDAIWAVGVLFGVSLAFTYVRVQLRSVAAAALLHASYNLYVFADLFIATGGYRHLDRLGH